jgi:hypothetical protein
MHVGEIPEMKMQRIFRLKEKCMQASNMLMISRFVNAVSFQVVKM